MAIAPFTLHCANARCQSANSSHDAICQRCGTPIPRRYLWAVGPSEAFPKEVGHLIESRYYVISDRLVLDTSPGLLPEIPPPEEDLPATFQPYLRLFPHRYAVPQVYGLLKGLSQPFYLLEGAPIYPQNGLAIQPDGSFRRAEGELMPTLGEAWPLATPQRQLGWLWQLIRLWEPLAQEGVAQTLLNPDLIRVEGSAIRLLALEASDRPENPPSLDWLGQVWLPWAVTAHTSIAPFLNGLIERLTSGALSQVEQVLPLLDQALAIACEGQTMELQVATCTDPGPQRKQNEDACLPQGGTFRMTRPGIQSITLVCDGLGGHDGGEVASQLSADSIHRYLQTPANLENTTPGIAMQRAVVKANDQLLKRNNDEQRFMRQRMGTTVVMSWVVKHLMYLGHVGDSRIYRVTPAGYTQLTTDDDVASQSVSYGQNVYRHAVRPSAAGALTQALGITDTKHLRPTIQRFFFDDEMLVLLCSDGLSDRNRVAEIWDRILQPVFTNNINVAVSAMQLLEAANQLNGHDNSTISLVHVKVKEQPVPETQPLLELLPPLPAEESPAEKEPVPSAVAAVPSGRPNPEPSAASSTEQSSASASKETSRRKRFIPFLWGMVVLGTLVPVAGFRAQFIQRSPSPTEAAEIESKRSTRSLSSASRRQRDAEGIQNLVPEPGEFGLELVMPEQAPAQSVDAKE